jgi:hypothetical protein
MGGLPTRSPLIIDLADRYRDPHRRECPLLPKQGLPPQPAFGPSRAEQRFKIENRRVGRGSVACKSSRIRTA